MYKFVDGSKYSGTWFDGKQHGFGVFTGTEGNKKYGVWNKGQKVRTLKKEDIDLLLKGKTKPHTLMNGTEEDYQSVQNCSVKFFYPTPAFQDIKEAHERAVKENEQTYRDFRKKHAN